MTRKSSFEEDSSEAGRSDVTLCADGDVVMGWKAMVTTCTSECGLRMLRHMSPEVKMLG